MDELERAALKFEREAELLGIQLDRLLESPSKEGTQLATAQAKTVRRCSTILLRKLAEKRDSYSQEA